MTDNQKARQKLQEELRKLFQFDVSDLDFGIYRILNRKKDQIEKFIEIDLLDAVEEGLKAYKQQDSSQVEEIKQQIIENLSDDAFDEKGNLVKYENTKLGKDYLEALNKAKKQQVGVDTEKKIYNDLFTFFTRYYDEGDFVTKRRISTRDSKYAIPYNGEEVLLHWANKDQYYIKTGEHFSNYKFEAHGKAVWFKVAQAEQDRDNIKEDEKRSFVLRPDNPIESDGDELTIWFEYRPMTDTEQEQWLKIYNNIEKSRKTLDRQALCIAFDEWIRSEVDGEWKKVLSVLPKNKDRSLLYNKLNHYTGKNTTDYFIHKDLKSFLERELEYYLKNEVIRVDDFIEDDTNLAMDTALTRAKVVRSIGKKIILFLSQIENFQKKLFEKRKFVVDTHYCFTLDHVPEDLYEIILKNEDQLNSWKELYAMDKWSGDMLWDGKWTKDFLKNHRFMMIDTKWFEIGFKYIILNYFDELDDTLNGLAFNCDNLQGLKLISNKFYNNIDAIVIDPPYNTGNDGFIYKDNFRDSSWLSFFVDRFEIGFNDLLKEDGFLVNNIDENENSLLASFYKTQYTKNFIGDFIWKARSGKGGTDSQIAVQHENIFVIGKSKSILKPDTRVGKSRRENLRQWGQGDRKEDRETMFFPIFLNQKGEFYINDEDKKLNIKDQKILPIKEDGTYGRWRAGRDTIKVLIKENQLELDETNDIIKIYRLYPEGNITRTPFDSFILDKGSASNGTKEIKQLFNKKVFPTTKPIELIKFLIDEVTYQKTKGFILDYFAGSGTLANAIIEKKSKNQSLNYIVMEMGKYFDVVLIKRILKSAFSTNWDMGIPQDQDGQSHAFKYHFIESYEDALNNIDFKNPEDTQQAMEFEDYLLSYMLDFETQGVSASLLKKGAFETPFDYKLKIQRGHESPKEENVDMVETFHYLIGLWVQKIRQYEHQKRRYVVSIGQIRSEDAVENVCIIWRNTNDLNLDTEAKWIQDEIIKNQTFDRIYINGVSKVKGAEPTEITFREKMFEDVV